MVKRGDAVVVNKPEFNMKNVECKILDTMIDDPHARQYYGEDCIIVEYKGNQIAVAKDEYKPVSKSKPSFDNVNETKSEIEKFSIFTLKNKEKGSKKLFYQVVDRHDNGISYINDYGYKVSLPYDKIKPVDLDNWFEYIDFLQHELFSLKQFTTELVDLFKNDISNMLDKLDW